MSSFSRDQRSRSSSTRGPSPSHIWWISARWSSSTAGWLLDRDKDKEFIERLRLLQFSANLGAHVRCIVIFVKLTISLSYPETKFQKASAAYGTSLKVPSGQQRFPRPRFRSLSCKVCWTRGRIRANTTALTYDRLARRIFPDQVYRCLLYLPFRYARVSRYSQW